VWSCPRTHPSVLACEFTVPDPADSCVEPCDSAPEPDDMFVRPCDPDTDEPVPADRSPDDPDCCEADLDSCDREESWDPDCDTDPSEPFPDNLKPCDRLSDPDPELPEPCASDKLSHDSSLEFAILMCTLLGEILCSRAYFFSVVVDTSILHLTSLRAATKSGMQK